MRRRPLDVSGAVRDLSVAITLLQGGDSVATANLLCSILEEIESHLRGQPTRVNFYPKDA